MNAESHWAAKRPIPFTNVSSEPIPAFAVMAITDVLYEKGIAFLACDKPSTTFRREYAVNNIFDVPADLHGTCFRAGDLRVLYDQGTPMAGAGWGPKPGQWSLAQGFPGFTVQGITSAVHKIAKASFEPITQVLVKTTGLVSAGATTQAYRVYAGPFGQETDAGFTSVPAAANRTGQSLDADEWAWLDWTGDGWELRCGQNRVYHATYVGGGVAPGSTGGAILPDGRVAVFTNWSSDAAIETNDKILVWQDFTNSAWYAIKSGGADPANVRLFRAVVDEASGFDGDGTITVDNFEAFDNEPGEPGTTNVDNPLGLWGENNDWCLVAESPGLAGNGYTLVHTQQRRQPRWFKATLGGTLASATTAVSVTTTDALDGGSHPGSVTANNGWGLSGANLAPCLIVEDLSQEPSGYELVQVKHVVKTLIQNVDYSDPNLRKTTQDITVMHEADPDIPTNILTAAEATYVSDVNYNDATGALTYDTRVAKVLSDAAGTSGNSILTASNITVVIDVDVSGTTLRKNQQGIRVLGSDTAGGLTTYHTGSTCS